MVHQMFNLLKLALHFEVLFENEIQFLKEIMMRKGEILLKALLILWEIFTGLFFNSLVQENWFFIKIYFSDWGKEIDYWSPSLYSFELMAFQLFFSSFFSNLLNNFLKFLSLAIQCLQKYNSLLLISRCKNTLN